MDRLFAKAESETVDEREELKVDTFWGRPRLEAGLVHVKCPLCYTCLLPTDHIFSLLLQLCYSASTGTSLKCGVQF